MEISTKSFFKCKQILNLCCIWIFLGHLNLTAQITITENVLTGNIDKVFKEVLYETDLDIGPQLAEIIAATGANQSWDFSNLNYVDSTLFITELRNVPPNDPYINDPNFAGSNLIVKDIFPPVSGGPMDTSIQFRYATLDNGNWTVNGAITISDIDLDGMVDTFMQWFSPPTLVVKFPINSTSEWHDSTTIVQNFMGMPFTSSIMLDSNWVEAWGTIITPAGSAAALRVRQKSITTIPGNPFPDLSNDLSFFTSDGNLTASIVLEDGRAFYTTRTDLGATTSTINLPEFNFRLAQNYPNPFKEHTTIVFTMAKAGKVQLQLLDINGNAQDLLANEYFQEGRHEFSWLNRHLPAGIYILEMKMGNQIQHRTMQLGN